LLKKRTTSEKEKAAVKRE
jgi:hypothetical protein